MTACDIAAPAPPRFTPEQLRDNLRDNLRDDITDAIAHAVKHGLSPAEACEIVAVVTFAAVGVAIEIQAQEP